MNISISSKPTLSLIDSPPSSDTNGYPLLKLHINQSYSFQPNSSQFSTPMTKYTFGLVPISKVPYEPYSNWNLLLFDYVQWLITLLKRSESIPIKYNIDASFTQSRYFVIPNVKGLCNRFQLFAGLYILSSYFHIPIILSSSMEWSKYWNLRESFPGQLIELPDRGTLCSIVIVILSE